MTDYHPLPWQPLITEGITGQRRVNIFASMGSGKTTSTVEAIAQLILFGEV